MIKLHFHADSDGVVSAFFVSKELDRLNLEYSLHPSLGAYVEFTGKNNISLDISNVKSSEKINLVIDHHISDKLNLFYSNPRQSGFEWPVSFTTYALFGEKKLAWVSAIGVVADWCVDRVPKQFWEIVKDEVPELIPKVDQIYLANHLLGEMALMIDCAISKYRAKGALLALEVLKSSKTYKEILNGKGKAAQLKKIKKEILNEVESIFGNEIITDKLILLKFKSNHKIKSLVAAWAKSKYPDRMIIIAQEERDTVRLSFRHGDDLNNLIKELTKGIGDGGGHPQASGGFVKKKYWETFTERLFNKIK